MGANNLRSSLCYIVGHYTASGHTAHLPRLLQELSLHTDVYVVLWSHEQIPEIPGVGAIYTLEDKSANRFFRVTKFLGLVWRLRRQGCRVFFVRIQYDLAILLAPLRWLLGLKVFLWRSGYHLTTKPHVGWTLGQIKRRFYWWFREKILFRLATRLVTRFATGPATMIEYYRQEYGVPESKFLPLDNDVDVIALGEFHARYDKAALRGGLGLPESAEILLYVGGVSPRKLGPGGKAMLEIAQQVLNKRPSAHIILVGPVFLPELRDALEQSSLHERVHFTGMVPLQEVINYYLAADVCIFPCAEAGFPRVLLEAMALGSPFVTFDIGGFRDLVEADQESCVVPEGDTQHFTEQIEMILDDNEWCQKLREIGLERVKMFSTEVVARDFFEKVVSPFAGNYKG
jgi:glycosyltransferase involved in cell wall biosynthesis